MFDDDIGGAAHASVDGPPAHPPVSAAAPAAGAEDLTEACAGGGIVVGRIAPEILDGAALAAVLAFDDAPLVAWAINSDTARAVLSERERAEVAKLSKRALDLRDKDAVRARRTRDGWQAIADATRNAARFVRSILRGGSDHHIRRMRLDLGAAQAAAAAQPDDGVDALLDQVAAQHAVYLDGLRYVVMSIAFGARELRLSSPRRAASTFRPIPGTPTWRHTTGSRNKRHRWYRRLDDGRFIAEPR